MEVNVAGPELFYTMSQLVTIATCALDQWALDLDGNKDRIKAAIKSAKSQSAKLLITPELSIPSYGLLDHWLELDNYDLYFEVLADILADETLHDIIFDVGMPVCHRSTYYNCRVFCYNGEILFIRPKAVLANDGNFREARYFTAWSQARYSEVMDLPPCIQELKRQSSVRIGDVILETSDYPPISIGVEMCEEMFAPQAPHESLALDGVEIICNSSGSHHELRKLNERVNLILGASKKTHAAYMYSNLQGCDADRLYYDGTAMVCVNGQMVSQGSQFSLQDVEVLVATIDLDDIRSARYPPSFRNNAEKQPSYRRVRLPNKMAYSADHAALLAVTPSPPQQVVQYFDPEEEIALGPAAWLWDYLRRSNQSGFFLCLSGGIDSCATAVIVFSMCRMVYKAIEAGNEQVLTDLRRIAGEDQESSWVPEKPQDVCNKILHTAYMATSNSGSETRDRAKALAKAIGSYHLDFNFDTVISAFTTVIQTLFGLTLRYNTQGGTNAESLALQNIQARTRMCLAYLLAAILCQVRSQRGERPKGGGLLVLGSSNVDEALRGYFTKYDASSADLNPIGSISKLDLRKFISWAQKSFKLPQLDQFIKATPSAELIPNTSGIQSDEVEMGITYEELSMFGQLRKNYRLGPVGQFYRLLSTWRGRLSPREIFNKVRHFNHYYSINRHKMTTLTPSYHAESYSPEDNRFDLRPFLLPPFTWAYRKIERAVQALEEQ